MADEFPSQIVMRFNCEENKFVALRILERALQSLGDVGHDALAILTAIRANIPTEDFVADAVDIMSPTSLTSKIESRLRVIGIESTVWTRTASHGAYVFQALNGSKGNQSLQSISDYLSGCPELGPITCERSGPRGEHLTLRLRVGG